VCGHGGTDRLEHCIQEIVMDKKSNRIIYNIDEVPAPKYLIALSFQHALIPLMFLTYPILIAREIALPFDATVNLISVSLLLLGISTIIQCSKNRIGSGALAVHQSTPLFIPAYLAAAQSGGIGLASAMMCIAGVFEIALARSLRYINKVFTEEVCGVAILMLGVSMIPSAIKLFFGFDSGGHTVSLPCTAIAAVTLFLIIVTSVSKKHIRFYSLITGCAGGYLLALLLNCFPEGAKDNFLVSAWVALPHISPPSFTLSMELLPMFIITSAISSVDALGGMITIDKINHSDWEKQNMELSTRGVQTEGFGHLLSGLFGGYAGGVSSSNIGLSFATAVTSRYVGIGAGIILVVLAFFPKLSALLSIIPLPVVGAFLVYAAAFLICSGMDLILVRSLNHHKIFIVGLSVIGGIGCGSFTHITSGVPVWLRLIVNSPLTVATLIAITLTLLFKIGSTNKMTFHYRKNEEFDSAKCVDLFASNVTLKPEVISSSYKAINECIEALILADCLKDGSIDINLSYADAVFMAELRYPGTPLDLTRKAFDVNNLEDKDNAVQLALLLMANYAKDIAVKTDKQYSTVILKFKE